jgi:hypothetical protein
MRRLPARMAMIGLAIAIAVPSATPVHAQDFFSALFGGFVDDGPPPTPPRSSSGASGYERRDSRASYGGGGGSRQAFCVRTCDGRYFPISATDSTSRAASCNNFCPASETTVVYGSAIDQAATETGKSYTALPNAFKYRTELVAGCTCNGKDQLGLAPVKVEDDTTLRKGDIVAGAEGLMVTTRPDRRGASLGMSPASDAIRAKYERPLQE